MIYTIRYQEMTPEALRAIITKLNAILVDVRSSPRTRISGFGRKQLEATYGESYRWAGDILGGRPPGVQREGVELIRELDHGPRPVCLMCLEELPHNCHRHHTIALPHFPNAKHIFNGGWCYTVADVQANYAAYPAESPIDPIRHRTQCQGAEGTA